MQLATASGVTPGLQLAMSSGAAPIQMSSSSPYTSSGAAPAAVVELNKAETLKEFGKKEIAATAVLLAGPDGGFYVGATLSPNGGDVMY